MSTFRALWRLLVLAVFTGVISSIWLLGLPVALLRPAWRIAWRIRIVGPWARGVGRIIGMRVHVAGPRPEPPFCLVANHLSYLDVIVLHGIIRGIFVAKAEVGNWPVAGALARIGGTLFINRARKKDVLRINDELAQALEEGDGVVFFPEGTTSGGDRVYPFKASLLDLAARTGYPVSYASLRYRTPPGVPPASESICWWGKMTFTDHVFRVLKLPGFDAYVTFGEGTVREDDRKVLAEELRRRIEAQFEPTGVGISPRADELPRPTRG